MIDVRHLSKRFGATLAVNDISFEIPQGQVVGFLGPNGAGKTTTMRVLTGYLPPDDGEARLLGMDLIADGLAIRRRIGYLPENNPLPDDIEVTEYLHYIGRLRGLAGMAERNDRVRRVLKLCSLGNVVGKKLGELSKGYRQRVGIAQSIIHDPDVLILDEPTSGLDPNQVQDVRALIGDLRKQKTLILSTHILSEVRHTCDRVLIINKGKLVADGTPSDVADSLQNVNRVYVALRGPQSEIRDALTGLPGVKRVMDAPSEGEEGFVLESDSTTDVRDAIFSLATQRHWTILGLQQKKLSLEDVFHALTKAEAGGDHAAAV